LLDVDEIEADGDDISLDADLPPEEQIEATADRQASAEAKRRTGLAITIASILALIIAGIVLTNILASKPADREPPPTRANHPVATLPDRLPDTRPVELAAGVPAVEPDAGEGDDPPGAKQPDKLQDIPVAVADDKPLPPDAAPAPLPKIELDLTKLDAGGLRGPQGGKVSVSYEFCIPNTAKCKAAVKAIDPKVRFMPGSRGRIGAGKDECLCVGETRADYRTVLKRLADLPYIKRIIECHFE